MADRFAAELGITLGAHAVVSVLTLAAHISHIANVAKASTVVAHSKAWAVAKAGSRKVSSFVARAWKWHVEALVYYRHHFETALVLTLMLMVAGEMTKAALMGTWLYAVAEIIVTGREG